MKRLSDYKGEEAIILWGELLDCFTTIVVNEEVLQAFKDKKPTLLTAKLILKNCPKEAEKLLLTIDDTPVDGLNIIIRLVVLLDEISKEKELQTFFGLSADTGVKSEISTGSAMANTEGKDN